MGECGLTSVQGQSNFTVVVWTWEKAGELSGAERGR